MAVIYLNLLRRLTGSLVNTKTCNGGPSYRVGEASRAHPKGLDRLPNIYNLEMYQLQKKE